MDFKNFCQKNPAKEKESLFEEKQEDANNIKEQINHYSGKSQEELMKEFFKVSQNMNIDNNKINEITNKIGPMLNDEQRNKMEKLLNQIRK